MNRNRVYLFASRRNSMNVFSANGQPACLINTTTVGLPSSVGIRSFIEDGARLPHIGAAATSIGGGGGVAHDFHDFGTERFANGFAIGDNSFPPPSLLEDLVSGNESAFEGIPAFLRAILVVSFANILRVYADFAGGWDEKQNA